MMRKSKTLTAFLVAAALFVAAVFAAVPEKTRAKAYDDSLLYRLNFADESNLGENSAATSYEDAVVPQNNTFSVEKGIRGKNALVFPGGTKGTNYLSLPTEMFAGKDKVTIAGWFYLPTGAESYLGEIGIYSPDNGMAFRSDPYASFHGNAYIYCVGSVSGIDLDTRVKPVYDAWYHMAYVIDAASGTFVVYQNGAPVYESELQQDFSPSQWNTEQAHFYVGQSSYSGYENEGEHNDYHGKMSDIRVYGDALTQQSIREEYNLGIIDFMTNEYTFDNGSGEDTVRGYDLSGFNGNPVYAGGTMRVSGGAAALLYDKQNGVNVNYFAGLSSMTISMDIKINTPVSTFWRRVLDIYAAGNNRMTVMSSCAGTQKFEVAYCYGGVDRFTLRDSGNQAFDPILHEWFNLTISMSGYDVYVFENGALKAHGTSLPNPSFASLMFDVDNSSEGKAMMGNCPYETFNYIDAEYDNIRIYAAAATDEEQVAAAIQGYKSHSVTYMANDGSDQFVTSAVRDGSEAVIAENTFVREGYEFVAWNTEPDGSGESYIAGDTLTPYEDVTLYAVWNKVSVLLGFNANGGRGNMALQIIPENVPTNIQTNTFIRDGYDFIGWNTVPDGSGESYADGGEITISDDMLLYAVWRARTYTVSFDANGGDGEMSAQQFTYDEAKALPLNTFEREGYTFAGWSLTPTGVAVYTDGQQITSVMDGSDVTLYAVWLQTGYSVAFDGGGAEGSMPAISVKAYSYVVLPEIAFVYPGMEFVGWATENGGEAVYKDCEKLYVDGDMILYAVWIAGEYTVNFDANGGNGQMATLEKVSGEITLPENTFEREGYAFAGWSTKKSGGAEYADKALCMVDGDMTLYAVWEEPGGEEPEVEQTGGCGGCAEAKANGGAAGTVTLAAAAGLMFVVLRKKKW